jgi:PKD repeat protein
MWYPSLELFDALQTRPEHEYCAISQVNHGFYYEDEAIAGLTAINDSPTRLGDTTTLSASITAGTNVTYEWDLGDSQADVGDVVGHTYPAAGVYTAVVTASNSAGLSTATTIVTVEEEISGLNATNDSPTPLGSPTTLLATLSGGSGVISWDWALGDGEYASGQIVQHTYPASGTYTAVVTVSNLVSLATDTTEVTIVGTANYYYLPLILIAYP